MKTSRAQVWMENLGEWTWPGTAAAGGAAAVEALPPAWVPAFPPRLDRGAGAADAPAGTHSRRRALAPRLAWAAVLSALAVLCAALALNGPRSVEHSLGLRTADGIPAAVVTPADAAAARSIAERSQPLPTITPVSHDAAGSSIDAASYSSVALHGRGSFLVYLPPGYASTTRHYPVLYLLHGNNQLAGAFLQIGLQGELDSLIARHAIPPLIAVMIQGGRGANNWRSYGGRDYESYVLEVQALVDRVLPTVPNRAGRAIAGDSMGGYGAMNVALAHPYRFGAVESWLGFFNGLEGEVHADRHLLSRIGLRAFVYGGSEDTIADPSENAPFASALRAAGADAHSAVYPGEHSLETIHAHLPHMLLFAGHALSHGAGSSRPRSQARATGVRAPGRGAT
jgi:enterochelin esterase-like enzyme